MIRSIITTAALWLANSQSGRALALPVDPASALTVDLGYASYQGAHNPTTGLNVWKGYVEAREISAPHIQTTHLQLYHAEYVTQHHQQAINAGKLLLLPPQSPVVQSMPLFLDLFVLKDIQNRSPRLYHLRLGMKTVCSLTCIPLQMERENSSQCLCGFTGEDMAAEVLYKI
jgi:hypothetical protein